MTEPAQNRIVLVLGSAPDVVRCASWPKADGVDIVAINNAWRVREDWDYLVTPDDFPPDRLPPDPGPGQALVGSADYVPANNRYGGVFYAGGTMAFSAGYWALAALRPRVLAFLGCDMVYGDRGRTHFYGTGDADPLRDDPSLRSLEAKSARLMLHALRQGCACVRLSTGDSRLAFPSAHYPDLARIAAGDAAAAGALFDRAKRIEDRLGHVVPSGRYCDAGLDLDLDQIDRLDTLWREAAAAYLRAPVPR
jgi:hypothetical protein